MDKKYQIKWTAPAREDVSEIIDYIDRTNPAYAEKLLNLIYKNVKKLDMYPGRHRLVPEFEENGYLTYREIIVEYWRVIYKIEGDIIYIMLVIDGRRNIDSYLLNKMLLRES
ncbi:MAG: type II toxin-antitoxin system RelE/ParE family toxin [Treponema sp.]|nr:type II toxin-antitoxin system RelE/ParE family toxin [Treponema sp.]